MTMNEPRRTGRPRLYGETPSTAAQRKAAQRIRDMSRKLSNVTPQMALPESVPDGAQTCMFEAPDVKLSTDDNYTPSRVVESARRTLGAIDLDPASSLFAQSTVQAGQWCGLDHPDELRRNGLAVTWYGRVWCNPPFSKDKGNKDGFLKLFTKKLIVAYRCGDVRAACILTRADSSAAYSQDLRKVASASCWPFVRIPFVRPDIGERSNPNFTTIIWYLGKHTDRFYHAFKAIGDTRTEGTQPQ